MIRAGDPVSIRTASDEWRPAVALGGVEPTHKDGRKVHDFPVIYIAVTSDGVGVPWPAEDVVPRETDDLPPNAGSAS